jgi:tetratricopeptide (TPR) repeat protein
VRGFWLTLVVVSVLAGQPQRRPVVQQEPPEEDVSVAEKKEYTFNPLQAAKELRVGGFYYKKGSYRAAARRFEEATRWDPNNTEAWLRLGDTQAKLGDQKAARAAWAKVIELDPDSKQSAELRKKLGKS